MMPEFSAAPDWSSDNLCNAGIAQNHNLVLFLNMLVSEKNMSDAIDLFGIMYYPIGWINASVSVDSEQKNSVFVEKGR